MIKKLIEKRINSFVEKVLSERKDEINERVNKEINLYEVEQKKIILEKEEQLKKLVSEKNNSIRKIEEEKSHLSETLNIVNQNLTAHEIWMKLWSVAFDKAMDICWDLSKDNTKKIASLAKNDITQEIQIKTQNIINDHNKKIEEQLKNMSLNKMSVLNAKNEAYRSYLVYNKSGNKIKESYYTGQLELIERILNDKKV